MSDNNSQSQIPVEQGSEENRFVHNKPMESESFDRMVKFYETIDNNVETQTSSNSAASSGENEEISPNLQAIETGPVSTSQEK
jgi:hypothetical protein